MNPFDLPSGVLGPHALSPPPAWAAQWLAGLDEPAWLVAAATGRVQQANEAALDWLGEDALALTGRPADELLPSLEDMAFWAERQAERDGSARVLPDTRLVSEVELPRPDGQVAHLVRRIVPLGQPVQSFLVTLHDRSAELAVTRERDTVLAELRATLEATADGILVTDTAGHIRAFNRRFAALWQLPAAVLTGQDEASVLAWMQQSVLEPEGYQRQLGEIGSQLLLQHTDTVALLDGRVLERHTQPQWSAGRPIGRVWSFRQLQRQRSPLLQEGCAQGLDALTRWPNRAAFLSRVDDAVEGARHLGTPLSLLCVEFDRQALYALEGDSRARALGDLVEGLRASVHEPHLMARLGASRFAVLLTQSGESAAEQLARRLVALAAPGGQGLLATAGLRVHVGVALYPQAGLNADDLLQQAELAVQRAGSESTETGAGWRVQGLTPLSRPLDRRRQRLERVVREGLAGQALRLHFQPRLDSGTHRIHAVEALLRWQDTEAGLLLPGQFLRLADEAGVMGAIDDWVLEHALRQVAAWRQHNPALVLTVNLSAHTLCQPALARRVQALLLASQWPAEQLELDITEASVQKDPEGIALNLRALQRLGVRINLDDWGVGTTSLALLRQLPLNAVKFDRSILRHLPHQAQEVVMVQGLAQLAQALGLRVWACGVENEVQRHWLAQLGCDGWQGYLAAGPMEPRALERGLLARPDALARRLPPCPHLPEERLQA